jgi:hypothetical protein
VWAAWYVDWSLTLLFPDGVLTFLLLLFPDGRPLTRRWWAVFWGAAGLAASFLVITWLAPVPITLGGGLRSMPNPTGISSLSHLLYDVLGAGAWALSFVFLLAPGRARRGSARRGRSRPGAGAPVVVAT